jgi:hypothetical protein
VDCGGGFALCNGFLNFLFSFYVVKYFSDYFPKCNQTLEKQLFSLKSFTFTNILRWRIFYVETNEAFMSYLVMCALDLLWKGERVCIACKNVGRPFLLEFIIWKRKG